MAAGRSDADADALSETRSVTALLSPSDGFRSQTEVPDELLVPDPQQRNTQADKEREALEEQAAATSSSQDAHTAQPSHYAGVSRPASADSSRSSIVNTEDDDHRSLLPAAPPAYADIARDINVSGRPAFGYDTMWTDSSFFPNTSPQDLGGAEDQPLLAREPQPPQHSWRLTLRNGNRRRRLLALVCFVLLGLVIAMIVYTNHRGSKDESMTGQPAGARPVPVSCHHAIYTAKDKFAFASPSNFTLMEQHKKADGHWRQRVRISGEIRLQKALNQGDAVKVDVAYRTNQESVLAEVGLKPSSDAALQDEALDLWLPRYLEDSENTDDKACLDIDITVSIKPDTPFEKIFLSLKQLSIGIEDVIYTARTTILETQVGSQWASKSHSVTSREIRVHSETGTIRGNYPLYDLLSVGSETGTIDVHVDPKDADKHNLPAKFQAETSTGKIIVTAELENLPSRDYQTSISTGHGSVSLDPFMHGSHTELRSQTATLRATLYPVGPLDENSFILADTLTGTVNIGVAPHMSSPKERMAHLGGEYLSNTGTVKVTHPLQWEGTVQAHTSTGTLKVDWPGLSQSDADHGWLPPWLKFPGADFDGSKGKGDSVVKAKTGTGNVHLYGKDID